MNLTDIKELISKGRTEAAIQAVLELTKDTELESGAISISRSYRTFKRNVISGILDSNEERKEEALITRRLLDLLFEFELLQIKVIKTGIDQLKTEIEQAAPESFEAEEGEKEETLTTLDELSESVATIETLDEGSDEKPKILQRVGDFLSSLTEPGSKTAKIIAGAKNGVKIVQDIARTYNDVAVWVGLPQVPRILL